MSEEKLDHLGQTIIKCIAVGMAIFWLVMAGAVVAIGQTHEHVSNDIDWIQKNHPGCCGKEDCAPIPPGKLTWTPGGYVVDGQLVERWKVRRGQVRQPTACFHLDTMRVRCLFIPPVGG